MRSVDCRGSLPSQPGDVTDRVVLEQGVTKSRAYSTGTPSGNAPYRTGLARLNIAFRNRREEREVTGEHSRRIRPIRLPKGVRHQQGPHGTSLSPRRVEVAQILLGFPERSTLDNLPGIRFELLARSSCGQTGIAPRG
jgi:hypothetical protein